MLGKAGINFNEPTRVTELLLVLLGHLNYLKEIKNLHAGGLFQVFGFISLTM
jgi:hypothetical protein